MRTHDVISLGTGQTRLEGRSSLLGVGQWPSVAVALFSVLLIAGCAGEDLDPTAPQASPVKEEPTLEILEDDGGSPTPEQADSVVRGDEYRRQGEYQLALEAYSQAIAENPAEESAFVGRSSVYILLGDLNGAIEDASRAIELNPNNMDAHTLRGMALVASGEFERGAQDLDRGLTGIDFLVDGELELAEAYFSRGSARFFMLEFLAQPEGSGIIPRPSNWDLPYTDDFSDSSSGWEVGEFDGGSLSYADGVYAVASTIADGNMWGIASQDFGDVEIQVEALQVSAPESNNNGYGVACRVGSGLSGYFFLISGDGFFSIFVADGDNSSALIPWTETEFVRQGNSSNRIRVVCSGDDLSFYVNGELLGSASDTTFSSGDLALSAVTFEEAGTVVHFDNFEIKLP